MLGIDDAIAGGEKLLQDAIDKIWPGPVEKAQAQAIAVDSAARAAMATIKAQTGVMMAEAQSADKWTSRARPSFLYVVYAMILMSVPMGVVWAFEPAAADRIVTGMQKWLAGIPQPMWDLFTYGYLGYVLARGGDKSGGVLPFLTGKK